MESVKTEVSLENVENLKSDAERAERFRSTAKVDPCGIALVKKLDFHLMVGIHSGAEQEAHSSDDK
jgi:hypothetical protein